MTDTIRRGSRRNTRKWCRGKWGVAHQGRWQEWDYGWMKLWDQPPTMVLICTECGKRLEMVWPPGDVLAKARQNR